MDQNEEFSLKYSIVSFDGVPFLHSSTVTISNYTAQTKRKHNSIICT